MELLNQDLNKMEDLTSKLESVQNDHMEELDLKSFDGTD